MQMQKADVRYISKKKGFLLKWELWKWMVVDLNRSNWKAIKEMEGKQIEEDIGARNKPLEL